MKKVVVLLECAVVLLVGYIVLDKSGIELPSFDANKAYKQGIAFHKNKEYDKAFELYKKACDGGEMLGCTNLGVMYANGDGVEEDFSKAAKLLKKACDGGDMNGCRNLDIIYTLMAKQQKKLDKVADLYKKVCDNNIEECADILFFALNANQGILEFLGKIPPNPQKLSKEIAPSQ